MKLLLKFSLIFTTVFGAGLATVAWLGHGLLQNDARSQVLSQAKLLMQTAMAVRQYTTNFVKTSLQNPPRSDPFPSYLPKPTRDDQFHRVTVPAFAATEMFKLLHGPGQNDYTDYYYKEATLNPTNPRDRAVDWEQDVIHNFRNQAASDDHWTQGERSTPTGPSLYLARPLIARADCLECHGTPQDAPAGMRKLYGDQNGFQWKENEIIGAQIVSVPITVPTLMADHAFARWMLWLILVGVITLAVLNGVLYYAVVRPVSRFAANADAISRGDMQVAELPATGRDEVSILAKAFNRMHRSLAAAMKLLDQE